MLNKTSKALKKLLCAPLITGIVLTGFPATLWHSAYGNITHAEAAETTEEQWKTTRKLKRLRKKKSQRKKKQLRNQTNHLWMVRCPCLIFCRRRGNG